MKELSKYTPAELDAEIKLYKDAGVEVKKVSSKKDKVALIEELRKTVGTPHVITEEDLANNADLKDVAVGDVVVLPPLSAGPADDDKVTPPATTTSESLTPREENPVKKNLFYRGRPVVGVVNKIVNGKLYKEVSTTESTDLLTTEEYEEQVITK